MTGRPAVLFVCVHNAGRSQMAAAFLSHLAGGRVDVLSAGSEPADAVNPVAAAVMREAGIDITHAAPRLLAVDDVRASDVVITMGCGDACPVFPGKRYEDWQLDDPAGQDASWSGASATRSGRGSNGLSTSSSPMSPPGRRARRRIRPGRCQPPERPRSAAVA